MIDSNVEEVRKMLFDRMQRGYLKYGTTTERSDLNMLDWIQHLQEELLDAAVYCEALKSNLKKTMNDGK